MTIFWPLFCYRDDISFPDSRIEFNNIIFGNDCLNRLAITLDLDRNTGAEPAPDPQFRTDYGTGELVLFPRDVHLEAAAGTEAPDVSGRPGRWQGWQQVDFASVTLKQHLGYAGRTAEVAVNLERRATVEHIRQSAAGD